MCPIKEKENIAHIVWPNLIPCSKLQENVVTVLLLKSTPLLVSGLVLFEHKCTQPCIRKQNETSMTIK